jgi:hypothetical protein
LLSTIGTSAKTLLCGLFPISDLPVSKKRCSSVSEIQFIFFHNAECFVQLHMYVCTRFSQLLCDSCESKDVHNATKVTYVWVLHSYFKKTESIQTCFRTENRRKKLTRLKFPVRTCAGAWMQRHIHFSESYLTARFIKKMKLDIFHISLFLALFTPLFQKSISSLETCRWLSEASHIYIC